MRNVDVEAVRRFGYEWSRFDQSEVPESELRDIFAQYFHIFPWDAVTSRSVGFDVGCGSGRWARFVAPRIGTLHCIDPSREAVDVARRNLRSQDNCVFHVATAETMPLEDGSMDFGYALGVFHYVPSPYDGIKACVAKLKPGAPFLLCLYYAFDNRPTWFRLAWKLSDLGRRLISRLPARVGYWLTSGIALTVYWPLARAALVLERLGRDVDVLPLSAYRRRSLYTMRTDALNRFAAPLEHRFTKEQIRDMMQRAGLERVEFSPSAPYWCAVGRKKVACPEGR